MVWRFSSQGRVRWDFAKFFGQRLPTLMSLCSPTQTLGVSVRVHRKQTAGHQCPNKMTCLWTMGDNFKFWSTPGWKHFNSQTSPRLQIRATAEKEWSVRQFSHWVLSAGFGCGVVMSRFHFCAYHRPTSRRNRNSRKFNGEQPSVERQLETLATCLSVMWNVILPHCLVFCMWK